MLPNKELSPLQHEIMSGKPPIRALKFLSHPIRWQLIGALAQGSATVRYLSEALDLSPAKIRHHLRQLELAGIVYHIGNGSTSSLPRYELNKETLIALDAAFHRVLTPPVVSVVAKSGTGKTTFLEKLVPALKARGLKVGILKHHGHPTPFDIPGKDTYRMAQAGAARVVGSSAVQTARFTMEDGATDLDAVIADHFAGMDLVLTEGYKRGPYPKIEVHRSQRSDELLCEPDELLLLVTDKVWKIARPQFALDDAEGVADWLVRWLETRRT